VSAGERFERLLRFAASQGAAADGLDEARLFARIVDAGAAALSTGSVALTLRTAPSHLQLVGASEGIAARVEDLQMTLGEGPTFEAYASYGPVLVADLGSVERGRWPGFEAALTAADAGSLSALPLQLGAIRLGVLSVYRPSAGLLSRADLAAALEVADAVTTLLLTSGRAAPSDEAIVAWLAGSGTSNEINQATGMVIAQLGITAEEAYARLRAFAFSSERSLSDVALDVVQRRLRFADAG